jgi:hypothetical protein
MFSIVHRLAGSLLLMNETYYPLHIKMWLGPDVHRGVSFPLLNRKKSPKAQISTLVLSAITARKSRPNLSVSAKMCLTSWMSLLSPRLSLGNQRSFIIKCRWRELFMQTRLHYTGHCLPLPFPVGKEIIIAILPSSLQVRSARSPLLLPTRRTRYNLLHMRCFENPIDSGTERHRRCSD